MRPVIGITAGIEAQHFELNRQYAEAVEQAGAIPVLLVPSQNIAGLVSRIDGLMFPGGDDIHPSYYNEDIAHELKIVDKARTDFEFAIFHEIIRSKKPVLGICYGMQLINVAFGGNLYQDIESQMPVAADHKKGYHLIKAAGNRFFGSGEFNVNTSHHQAVKDIGKGLRAIAFSADGIIEAFCTENQPFLLGVQWHPERLKDDLSAKIFRSFVEASLEGR